jgi:P pilus assembly chaperone PapD
MFSSVVFQSRLALAALMALVLAAPAHAINVQPLVLDLVSAGANARSSIQVVNDSAAPLPVELVINRLEIGETGKLSETAAGDEFLVFPPQAIVPPGATQSFRVQWVGEPGIKRSQSYMFSVNQLPVKQKGAESGVQVVFNFGVIVNVAPVGAQSALMLTKTEVATEAGRRGAALTVENPGAMHAYFADSGVVLEGAGWRKAVSSSELKQIIGFGVVQPGKKRRFLVPVADMPASVSQVTARLSYTPKTAK